MVAGAGMVGKACRVAGAARILGRIADDMRSMTVSVQAAKPSGLAARLDGLLGALAQEASTGVTSGAIALDSDAAKHLSAAGTPVILVRQATVTTDIEGMALAAGILTGSGGRTSHAAVVARQLGKVCLVACPGLEIDLPKRQCRIGGTLLNEGDFLSLDGNSGAIHAGSAGAERPDRALAVIATWRIAAAA